MVGFLGQIGNMFQNGANAVRAAVLTPEELKARENGKRSLELIKVASIVSAIGALFFLGIFPNIFTLVLAGVVAFGAFEVYKVAENVLEMLKMATVEYTARSSKDNLIDQLGKNTFIISPILRAINPSFDGIL